MKFQSGSPKMIKLDTGNCQPLLRERGLRPDPSPHGPKIVSTGQVSGCILLFGRKRIASLKFLWYIKAKNIDHVRSIKSQRRR